MSNNYLLIIVCIIIVLVSGFLFFSNIGNNNPHSAAINTPDSDIGIDISNEFNGAVNIELIVERATTEEAVHNDSYTLDSGEGMEEVYNLKESNPDGIEDYIITATYGNQTQNITISTNQCYGDAVVNIRDDETLHTFYSIC